MCRGCRWFPVTAATPDTGRTIESVEGVGVTVRAGTGGPDGFESPLDDGVERFRPKLYCSEVNELLKHSTESSAFIGHVRLLSAGCRNLRDSVPLRYTRAFCLYGREPDLNWDDVYF